MENNSEVPITLTPDQKVAQFIFEKASVPQLVLSEHLDSTARGAQGFGSTNANHSIDTKSKHFFKRLYFSPSSTILYSSKKKCLPIVTKHKGDHDAHYCKLMQDANIAPNEYKHHPKLIPTNNIEPYIAVTSPTERIKQHQQLHQQQQSTTNMPVTRRPLYS